MELLLYAVFLIWVVAGIVGLAIGAVLAVSGGKNRGWESPWILVIREVLSMAAGTLIIGGYRSGSYSDLVALGLFAATPIPVAVYLLVNDRKHALETGREWRWL